MPTKLYPDYKVITADNLASIIEDHQRLIYKWLWQSKSPPMYFNAMSLRFWQQVWIDRKKFDRSRGKLSTWLTWKWKSWYQDASRAAKRGYHETPLRTGDHKQQVIPREKRPFIHHVGLDPETSTVLSGWFDNVENGLVENVIISSIHRDAIMNIDPEGVLVLEDLISRLPETDQKIVELCYLGKTHGEISAALNISLEEVPAGLTMNRNTPFDSGSH